MSDYDDDKRYIQSSEFFEVSRKPGKRAYCKNCYKERSTTILIEKHRKGTKFEHLPTSHLQYCSYCGFGLNGWDVDEQGNTILED